MTALDETPTAPLPAVWCGARAPHLDLVLCRRLLNHPGLHTSDGADDWSEPFRVSPPTTSNEETRDDQQR